MFVYYITTGLFIKSNLVLSSSRIKCLWRFLWKKYT